MTTLSERVAAVEQRLTDHEARCEERLGEIKAAAASTLHAVEGLKSRSWALVIALLAWALAQLWSGNEARLQRLESPPALTSATCQEGAPRLPDDQEKSA